MNIVDRRRKLPPSSAFPLIFDINKPENDNGEITQVTESPTLSINLSHIPTAIGSCYLQNKQNIISVSIYGPRPSFTKEFNSQANLNISIHSNPFINLDNIINTSTINSTCQTAFSNLILLGNYPKSNIDIFINIISIDSNVSEINLLSLIHNATNLALSDSGIAIKNTPACGTFISNGSKILVNSIHSNNYSNDSIENTENEEILLLYCPKLDTDFTSSLNSALIDARNLRFEFSNFLLNSL